MNKKYFNKMPFPVPLKKIWEQGCPAVKLQPGEVIEGPEEHMQHFMFLGPMPFDFHQVESQTQSQSFEFKDEVINQHVPSMGIEPMKAEHSYEELLPPGPHSIQQESIPIPNVPAEQPVVVVKNIDSTEMPFDPKNVDWFKVKNEDLKKACEILHIDLSHLDTLPKKSVKWDLIGKIKKAYGLEGK